MAAPPTEHDPKTLLRYKEQAEETGAKIAGRNGWVIDWFKEPMPLENKHATCMNKMLNDFAFPPQTYEDPPNAGTAPPMSVLVFADSYDYATDILKYAPQNRVGRKQIVTTPPSQISAKKVDTLLAPGWDMILFTVGIDEPKNNTSEEIHRTQSAICNLLMLLGKAINNDKLLCKYIAVVTVDTFAEEREVHEQCGVGLVANSTLFGFCNTLRLEADIMLQYIDTEWSLPETMMPYLSAEVFRLETFGRNSVRILKSGRYVLRQINPVPECVEDGSPLDLPESGVIGISGGNGGVAIIIGGWLVKQCGLRGLKGVKFMFLSRSMKISDANMPFWKALEADAAKWGVEVVQAKADVSNKESCMEWVAEHASVLGGFVHSAGVLADTPLYKIEWEQFDTVWNPKSRAALWLHEAFEKYGCPIKLFWMFSSTSVFGNPGQLNYSASNAFMDGLTRHRRALGKASLVLAWGPWGEVGMATTLDERTKKRMAAGPMPYFSNAEGIDGTETVIASGYPQGQVYKVSPEAFIGMCNMPHSNPSACTQVNFYSTVAAPLPTLDFSSKNAYMIYKSMVGHAVDPREGLVYKYYVKPRLNGADEVEAC